MSKAIPLTPFVAVAPQLTETDLADLAKRGYVTIINNRPDGEEPGQPKHEALAAAAQQAGLNYLYLPVVSGAINDDNIAQFTQALQTQRGPMLAFCRTGTRSTYLWALSLAPRYAPAAIIDAAAAAGYDLMPLRSHLEARWQNGAG